MSNEYQPQFENDLAGANQLEEIDIEQNKPTNDPAKYLDEGLITIYDRFLDKINSRLEAGLMDQEKADELADAVLALAKKDGLKEKIGIRAIERAKEIMGSGNFFGKEEVEGVFEFEINERIPPIPFSEQELTKAKELGQFLILRIAKTPDGQPLTMQKIEELLQPKFFRDHKGRIFKDDHRRERAFRLPLETPNFEWALSTHELIVGSRGADYLGQTRALVDYLEERVFAGEIMPPEFESAIAQFNASKAEIERLMKSDVISDRKAASKQLSELAINQLMRHSAIEVIYDSLIYYRHTGYHIPRYGSTWTKSFDETEPIFVYEYSGFVVLTDPINYNLNDSLGTLFSRTK